MVGHSRHCEMMTPGERHLCPRPSGRPNWVEYDIQNPTTTGTVQTKDVLWRTLDVYVGCGVYQNPGGAFEAGRTRLLTSALQDLPQGACAFQCLERWPPGAGKGLAPWRQPRGRYC